MANICNFNLHVVSKDRESLERLLSIFRYEDEEYHFYRIFNCDFSQKPEQNEKTGLWSAYLTGSVAWACNMLVYGEERPDMKRDNGSHRTNLANVCGKLGIAAEIWADEYGMSFEQYALVDNYGKLKHFEQKDFVFSRSDDDCETMERVGGFEEFGEFSFDDEIFSD